MTYKEAREYYLEFYYMPVSPSELCRKYDGLENLRQIILTEFSDVLNEWYEQLLIF